LSGGAASGDRRLVASVHTDPRSFNRFVARDSTTDLVAMLTQGHLVRLNRATQALEPSLAESWSRSADGTRYTLTLRSGITFSDGHPFTSDDVVFSFRAAFDRKSIVGDQLRVAGKPIEAMAPDPKTVVIVFPQPFAPGLRMLDVIPILPKHKLGAALAA